MTINEEKRLRNYIENLVRESFDDDNYYDDDLSNRYSDDAEDEPDDFMDDDEDEIAGLDELRKLCEGFAAGAVKSYLNEGKKKGKNKSIRSKDGKKKDSKEKKSRNEKSIMAKLNSDGVNAASYFYKLYGAKTDAEKASARSKGYKKAKGKKNDTGVPYRFSSKERNRLSSMLTDR